MKKGLLILALAGVSLMASGGAEAKAAPGDVEKKGFLATEWCVKNSYLKDCRLESIETSKPALYIHSEQKYYVLDLEGSPVGKHELDEGFARNDVTIIGTLQGNVIKVKGYKAPPPEGKSFFKGCM